MTKVQLTLNLSGYSNPILFNVNPGLKTINFTLYIVRLSKIDCSGFNVGRIVYADFRKSAKGLGYYLAINGVIFGER